MAQTRDGPELVSGASSSGETEEESVRASHQENVLHRPAHGVGQTGGSEHPGGSCKTSTQRCKRSQVRSTSRR